MILRPLLASLAVSAVVTQAQTSTASSASPTQTTTVNATSTQFGFTGAWQRDTIEGGRAIAYSNASDASFTFSFKGVEAIYIGQDKFDRGRANITVDGTSTGQVVDQYQSSGTGTFGPVWRSGVLPNGNHRVVVSQLGVDSRVGYVPYLFTAEWQQLTTEDADEESSSNTGAIVGGVVGGIAIIALLAIAAFCLRRRRNRQKAAQTTPFAPVAASRPPRNHHETEKAPDRSSFGDLIINRASQAYPSAPHSPQHTFVDQSRPVSQTPSTLLPYPSEGYRPNSLGGAPNHSGLPATHRLPDPSPPTEVDGDTATLTDSRPLPFAQRAEAWDPASQIPLAKPL